jgi:hypothetical protein
MEITERLPLKPINWLSQLSYLEFIERCLNKDKKHKVKVKNHRYFYHPCKKTIIAWW